MLYHLPYVFTAAAVLVAVAVSAASMYAVGTKLDKLVCRLRITNDTGCDCCGFFVPEYK